MYRRNTQRQKDATPENDRSDPRPNSWNRKKPQRLLLEERIARARQMYEKTVTRRKFVIGDFMLNICRADPLSGAMLLRGMLDRGRAAGLPVPVEFETITENAVHEAFLPEQYKGRNLGAAAAGVSCLYFRFRRDALDCGRTSLDADKIKDLAAGLTDICAPFPGAEVADFIQAVPVYCFVIPSGIILDYAPLTCSPEEAVRMISGPAGDEVVAWNRDVIPVSAAGLAGKTVRLFLPRGVVDADALLFAKEVFDTEYPETVPVEMSVSVCSFPYELDLALRGIAIDDIPGPDWVFLGCLDSEGQAATKRKSRREIFRKAPSRISLSGLRRRGVAPSGKSKRWRRPCPR